MAEPKLVSSLSSQSKWKSIAGVSIGLATGILAGFQPLLLGAAIASLAILIGFFLHFESTVLGLLVLRSSLDIFTEQQLPAAFAIGIDILTILYVAILSIQHKTIRTDWFWWLFAGWVLLQGVWVILLPIGGLGLGGSVLLDSVREWVRIFSWLMIYLLVMQLQNRIKAKKVIMVLFLGLIVPLTVASIQIILPESMLPELISPTGSSLSGSLESISRINGTLGHSNTFTTFLFLFLGLTYWQQRHAQNRRLWILILAVLAFFFVSTKALFGLVMLATFVIVMIAPRLSLPSLAGGILLIGLVISLFASTEFGQERLGSIAQTPLLNPDMSVWKAILLSRGDGNSFNWRLAQWNYLLEQWRQFPLFGYGLGTNTFVSANGLEPHNDYIRALVEGGIIGFITFIGFLVVQILRLIQLIQLAPPGSAKRDLCSILLAIAIAICVGMITENIWSHTTLFFYWFTLLAVVSWDWQENLPSDN